MSVFLADLQVDQGADFSFTTTPWIVAGAPVNLAGCAARLMARASLDAPDLLLSVSNVASSSGVLILNPSGVLGTLLVQIAKAATLILPSRSAPPIYDCFVDFPSGVSTRLLSGRLLVSPSVTR